jgi:predicted ester cyclase
VPECDDSTHHRRSSLSAGRGQFSGLVDEDDAVFVEVTLSGTHQGEWAGIPATGRRASVRIACLYEFEEDRLVCERVWFDFATILRQLGVLTS